MCGPQSSRLYSTGWRSEAWKKKIPEVILKLTLGSRVVGKMKIAGESDVFSGKPNPSPNFIHFSENSVE